MRSWRFVLMCIGVSTLAASVAWCISYSEKAQLRVEWDALQHDFGVVGSGDTLRHTFVVHNTSPYLIEVGSVRPSCGCVAHSIDRRAIPPHESCAITVDVSTKGLVPPAEVSKHIDVTLEQNGTTQIQRLSVFAELRPAVLIDQSPMVLTNSGPDSTVAGRLTVRRGTLTPEAFLTVTPRIPLCYRLSNIEKSTETFILDITVPVERLPARLPPLSLNYTAQMSTNVIDVPVRLSGNPNVQVVPPSVVMMTDASNIDYESTQRETKFVDVESQTGQSVRITDVHLVSEDERDLFNWSIVPDSPKTLVIALESPPTDAVVHSCRFDITYELGSTHSQGRAVLRAYAVKTKKLRASSP